MTSTTEYNSLSIIAELAPTAIKITCFVLGYLVVRMGYFLLEKGVKGEFKFKGTFAGAHTDLASASPGLLFVLLGIILIAYAMAVNKTIELKHHITHTTYRPATSLPATPLPPLPRHKKLTQGQSQ